MSKHDMGPSTIEGFGQQCRKCKALDTEIKFARGQECPVPDENEAKTITLDPATMSWHERVAWVQASWFHNFHMRQLERAAKAKP